MGCENLDQWNSADIKSLTLNKSQAFLFNQALIEDAKDYYYKALISFSEAINSIRRFIFSWATIKLYYCIFYLLRTYFCLNRLGFIRNKSLYILQAKENESPAKKSNTKKYSSDHKATIYYHIDFHLSDDILLTNKIDELYSYEWMLKKRENVNYREAKFYEPECPPYWQALVDFEIDKIDSDIIKTLIDDDYNLTFQEEYAYIAIPLKKLQNIKSSFQSKGINRFFSSLQMNAISEICEDKMLINWMLENQ